MQIGIGAAITTYEKKEMEESMSLFKFEESILLVMIWEIRL